jgi:hypothetical protein
MIFKYRVWDEENKEMFYDVGIRPSWVRDQRYIDIYHPDWESDECGGWVAEEDGLILMPYIGRCDDKRNEIYLFDIIKHGPFSPNHDQERISLVLWDEYGCNFIGQDIEEPNIFYTFNSINHCGDFLIIGNKFKNSDLLIKGEK